MEKTWPKVLVFLLTIYCPLSFGLENSPYSLVSPSMGNGGIFVSLEGLDKTTGKNFSLDARVGSKVVFGTLTIYIRQGHYSALEEKTEASAFLEIWEEKSGLKERIFSSWMFASEPAITGLDHPVYDVWISNCYEKK